MRFPSDYLAHLYEEVSKKKMDNLKIIDEVGQQIVMNGCNAEVLQEEYNHRYSDDMYYRRLLTDLDTWRKLANREEMEEKVAEEWSSGEEYEIEEED